MENGKLANENVLIYKILLFLVYEFNGRVKFRRISFKTPNPEQRERTFHNKTCSAL
jgi:hypothetical protein